ncbi:hypothetical protein ACFCWG_48930 [Streptomyces sp. NPDC056390]|uniref:hypothetical protein n=1 Tax=Streptomyces sp. NPDC056390 TaxID=3345806 RepID=UPI0035D7C65C
MTSSAKILVGKAEAAVNKANGNNSHPDDINRALAATQLALAQSNVEIAALLNVFTESATKPTGAIKKLVEQLNKHLGAMAGKA